MDIFVRGIPSNTTHKQLKYFFSGPLRDCGIHVFYVEKLGNKDYLANITVLDAKAGQVFLDYYGVAPNAPRHIMALRRLHMGGNLIKCSKSHHEPSDLSLQSLQHEKMQQTAITIRNAPPAPPNNTPENRVANKFNIDELQCGVWDYSSETQQARSNLAFVSHYTDARSGEVIFGQRQAIILFGPDGSGRQRLDINYNDLHDIVLGSYGAPTVTFNLTMAPRIYGISAVDELAQLLQSALIGSPRASKPQKPKKMRLPALNAQHAKAVGICWVHRVTLRNDKLLTNVRNLLAKNSRMCPVLSLKTTVQYPSTTLERTLSRLEFELTDQYRFGSKPYLLRFQISRLARNGLLSPVKVLAIIPKISTVYHSHGLNPTVSAIRRLGRDLKHYPSGPSSQAQDFSVQALEKLLEKYAASYDGRAPDNPYELAKRHTHINLIHKIIITPTATYLEGPEPEPTNRVLRRYADNTGDFARAIFRDEDGIALRHDPRSNNEVIYHQRFKVDVLQKGILICGKGFSFLGFANSSLRAQSVWFMAPLVNQSRTLSFAEHILKELGDFTNIRVPAKCAARIGQNFTDTNATVELRPGQVSWLPMVTRNTRDFSDGVGTISAELLQRVWRVYGTKRLLKPTALQIRFQGCKGMVSLDSRLNGQCLMLRANMKKYDTDAVWDLEICGAVFRPLPMFLNRQLIKILEDLGLPYDVFHDLQASAVNKLRQMTDSCINTAHMLEQVQRSKSTKLPTLIRHLGHLGLDYQQDDFLWKIVQMIIISEIRDIKYRGRIPVEEGMTLYGIMDETGYLREGEIFVITEQAPQGGMRILIKNNVVITRSPAMHPGDVQVVNAVDVPADSPLHDLRNVVVFSQQGDRDLPSQLSGGDLDGDIYNIMWSPRMVPRDTFPAADYPRLLAKELDREVQLKDMREFFIDFCESG